MLSDTIYLLWLVGWRPPSLFGGLTNYCHSPRGKVVCWNLICGTQIDNRKLRKCRNIHGILLHRVEWSVSGLYDFVGCVMKLLCVNIVWIGLHAIFLRTSEGKDRDSIRKINVTIVLRVRPWARRHIPFSRMHEIVSNQGAKVYEPWKRTVRVMRTG